MRESQMDDPQDTGEVLFEILRVGEVQRCAAIHAASGIEVVIQGPASASQSDLHRVALRKLEWVMGGGSGDPPASPPTRPGTIVWHNARRPTKARACD
jgi:hypothetical protein